MVEIVQLLKVEYYTKFSNVSDSDDGYLDNGDVADYDDGGGDVGGIGGDGAVCYLLRNQ